MKDPYQVLGLPVTANDAEIRSRYLALTRQFPPEKHPEKFSAIREAYESLRDLNIRLRRRLFEPVNPDILDSIIEELECQTGRQTLSLNTLLTVQRRS